MRSRTSCFLAIASAIALIAGCGGSASTIAQSTASPVAVSPTVPIATGTPRPTLIPYPGPSIPAGTLTLQVVAHSYDFNVSELAAPADTPFAIHFENLQAGILHNVAIRLGLTYLFNPAPFDGVETVDYYISSGLPAGKYRFVCTVHANMAGDLVIH